MEVAPECKRKTREMGGGREETWLKVSVHGGKDVADEEAKDGAAIEFDGEAECGEETRAENRSSWKMIRPIFRPKRKKNPMRVDRLGPTQKVADSVEIVRFRHSRMRMRKKTD